MEHTPSSLGTLSRTDDGSWSVLRRYGAPALLALGQLLQSAQGQELQRHAVPEERIDTWMRGLNADKYRLREETHADVLRCLHGAFDDPVEDSDALLQRLMFEQTGAKRATTTEQQLRLQTYRALVERQRSQHPLAVSARGNVTGLEAFNMVLQETRAPILVDDERIRAFQRIPVTLKDERQTRHVNTILTQLLNTTRSVPHVRGDGVSELRAAAKGESMVCSPDLLCIKRERPAKHTEYVLHPEPGRGSIVALFNEQDEYSGFPENVVEWIEEATGLRPPIATHVILSLPESDRQAWARAPWHKKPYAVLVARKEPTIDAYVADVPDSALLDMEGARTLVGRQFASVISVFQREDVWHITIVTEPLDADSWECTSAEQDGLLRGVAGLNHITFLKKQGDTQVTMPFIPLDVCFDQRLQRWTYVCAEKPDAIKLQTYARLQKRTLRLPSFAAVR